MTDSGNHQAQIDNVLSASGVIKDWAGTRVLHGIDLTVPRGQFLAIMGPSGSGKSTLLHILAGMAQPTEGIVRVGDSLLTGLDESRLAALRLRRIGFVFQTTHFMRTLDIADNIALPGVLAGDRPRRAVAERAMELMVRMGVDQTAEHQMNEVSGGQLQRAAICRALINDPEVLLGDEPTGALNSAAATQVLDLLTEINRAGTSVVLVTHDPKVAARADRVVVLVDGRIVADHLTDTPRGRNATARLAQVTELLTSHGI